MSSFAYYIIATVLAVAILYGLHLMSNVKTAVRGNAIAALAMALAILITMLRDDSFGSVTLWVAIAAGMAFGLFLSNKVKMIQMPQLVAFLHGFGGGAAALVGLIMLVDVGPESAFHRIDACLALCSGMTTIAGSFVAAGKLHQVLPQRPIVLPNHSRIVNILLGIMGVALVIYNIAPDFLPWLMIGLMFVTGALFGVVFTLRVGGADMPITISLLNSMGGISCAIAGFAVADPLLIAVGGIIGSAGYMLTRVMCKAMNRRLMPILLGESSVAGKKPGAAPAAAAPAAPKSPAGPSGAAAAPAADAEANDDAEIAKLLRGANRVIIVPGYGMALAQAQHQVKQLADALEANGAKVDYAIHPVAGRMPGHMNVLLAEANVEYEHLLEMDTVNPLFPEADAVVIVGANDVVNPAANTAEGTPIYGMPILDVDKAKGIIVCNYDEKPGYAGVPNPLYKKQGVHMRLGDAAKTVAHLVDLAKGNVAAPAAAGAATPTAGDDDAALSKLLHEAKRVIIVPGYGMALAQAQHQVKQLAEALEANGAKVDYAIHPVAGRMPGHMNVLLAEANVDYEHLLEMETVNPLFPEADLVVIVGANDVVNPAANTAEGTPIYGMPILDVDKAKGVIVCNYDEKPGYAGVPNPLYKKEGVHMRLGDAAKTVAHLVDLAKGDVKAPAAAAPAAGAASGASDEARAADMLKNAKRVIIVPGYGMALAQAQHKVKQLADALEANGAKVDYAIHPVAGRMPGHMNVLLAEANVDYEHLLEMDTVNPLFPEADLVVIVGANDVVNPAANTAEGTPIYGMPILDVDKAKGVIVCNYDGKPGYAGVENPLYSKPGAILMFGDAAKTVGRLVDLAQGATPEGGAAPAAADAAAGSAAPAGAGDAAAMLKNARRVIIVPGYGMALAQAQHKVKQLADALEANGAKVDYAIHPVAGRMPGHMNVLLAEANVDYEHLLEMDTVNPLFPEADLVVIVGANDVVNPAANTAEGTPIYGMPILDVDKAKGVIICNYDEKPGYAGVENPLYSKPGVVMMLGDAAASLDKLLAMLRG
ncbi:MULTISPECIES: NAD(P)(+) transhydrogenase (Re/Si-specific) subunit beta [unclassified Desulfovibrio]|uniref:NAD(P)(+) transhydrogenase (Re/Si-specific) subunit beta n=1 Tax=unclassified Desulfovibrio TaxID=2593640 RepID=UPI0013EDA9A8|nr:MULTISPECIES: NAD(P)(+) transhydrogenase (Re/Si-specific) subunit beta [unclassified Desulfovibrio]